MSNVSKLSEDQQELASVYEHYGVFAEIEGISQFSGGRFYLSDSFKSTEEFESHRTYLLGSGAKMQLWFILCSTREHFFANVIKINSELRGLEEDGVLNEFYEAAGINPKQGKSA